MKPLRSEEATERSVKPQGLKWMLFCRESARKSDQVAVPFAPSGRSSLPVCHSRVQDNMKVFLKEVDPYGFQSLCRRVALFDH